MATHPFVAQLFEEWLIKARPGDAIVYHRGHLARDRVGDMVLSGLADRVLQLCVGRFDLVSACGHVRGELRGQGLVEAKTRRAQGQTVYLAVRR